MRHLVADVRRRYEPVSSQLLLNAEIPLLDIGPPGVGVERIVSAALRKRRGTAEYEGKGITAWKTGIRVSQTACRTVHNDLSAEGRSHTRLYEQLRAVLVIEDSVAGPNHCAAISRRIPNDSCPRRKLVPTLVDTRTAVGAE